MTWNNETRDIKDGKKESLFSELHSLLSSGLDFGRSFRLLIEGEKRQAIETFAGKSLRIGCQGANLVGEFCCQQTIHGVRLRGFADWRRDGTC